MADPLSFEFVAVHTVEDDWYMDALADTMDSESSRLIDVIRANAPVATGALRDSVSVELHPDGLTVRAGTDYGGYLDKGEQYHHLGSGRPTKGWFSDPVGQFPESIMVPWVRLIESQWNG